jgi:hypothetical protein
MEFKLEHNYLITFIENTSNIPAVELTHELIYIGKLSKGYYEDDPEYCFVISSNFIDESSDLERGYLTPSDLKSPEFNFEDYDIVDEEYIEVAKKYFDTLEYTFIWLSEKQIKQYKQITILKSIITQIIEELNN